MTVFNKSLGTLHDAEALGIHILFVGTKKKYVLLQFYAFLDFTHFSFPFVNFALYLFIVINLPCT